MMLDTDVLLWIIPAAAVVFAIAVKAYVHFVMNRHNPDRAGEKGTLT